MHARAHTSRKRARAHLCFVIEGIMQQFEPFQPGFWDSQDFNWILYDWTHIPLPNVHMNQPSSLFSNFKTIFFSSIMSVNFYKYCHIIIWWNVDSKGWQIIHTGTAWAIASILKKETSVTESLPTRTLWTLDMVGIMEGMCIFVYPTWIYENYVCVCFACVSFICPT